VLDAIGLIEKHRTNGLLIDTSSGSVLG